MAGSGKLMFGIQFCTKVLSSPFFVEMLRRAEAPSPGKN